MGDAVGVLGGEDFGEGAADWDLGGKRSSVLDGIGAVRPFHALDEGHEDVGSVGKIAGHHGAPALGRFRRRPPGPGAETQSMTDGKG